MTSNCLRFALLCSVWLLPFFTPSVFSQKSMTFDGTNAYIQIADNAIFPTTAITVESWIRPNISTNYQTIIAKYNSYTANHSWYLGLSPAGKIRFFVFQNGIGSIGKGGETLNSIATYGAWQHVSATFDVTTQNIKIYVNGVEQTFDLEAGYTGQVTTIFDSNAPIQIGTVSGGLGSLVEYWSGSMDETRVWNIARTASEIQATYNKTFCNTPAGLVAYYKFENLENLSIGNSGTNDVRDYSGNNFHGDALGGVVLTTDAPILTPLLPEVSIVDLAPNFCKNDGIAPLNGSPTGGSFTIDGNAVTAFNPSLQTAGNHTVTYAYTDASGCSNSISQVVEVRDTANFFVEIRPDTNTYLSCKNRNVIVKAQPDGIVPVANFMWSTGASSIQFIEPQTAGTYYVTVTAQNGCTSVGSQVVTQDTTKPNLTLTRLGPNDTLTCQITTILLEAAANNAQFLWSTGNTMSSIATTAAGTYSVTATSDLNGCKASASKEIFGNSAPPSPPSVSPLFYCQNAPANMLSAVGQSLKWYTTATGGAEVGFTPTPFTGTVGTITFYVSQTVNFCESARVALVVTINPLPTVSIQNLNNIYCKNTAPVVLAGTPTGGVFKIDNQTAVNFTPSVQTAGNHTVTYSFTDNNGCSNTANKIVEVLDTASLLVEIRPDTSLKLTCINLDVIVKAQTNYLANAPILPIASFLWHNGTVNQSVTTQQTGLHAVTVTAQNGCISKGETTVERDITPPSLTLTRLGFSDTLTCQITTIILEAAANSSQFVWSTGNTMSSIEVTNAGIYSVTATSDINGCTASASKAIGKKTPPTVSLGNDRSICNGGSTVLTPVVTKGTAPFSFVWFKNGVQTATTNTLTASESGTYIVIMSDNATCTAADTVVISISNSLNANVTPPQTTCQGQNITLVSAPSGGASPYQFIWSNGSTTPSITVNANGTYRVTVTDANGCTAIGITSANFTPLSILTQNATLTGSCPTNYKTLTANVLSATAYLWSTGATTPTITVIGAGTHSVTVTTGACQRTVINFTIPDNLPPTFTLAVDDPDCYRERGEITVNGLAATGFQYRRNGGSWQTSPIFSNLGSGRYIIDVRKTNAACYRRDSANVALAPPKLTASIQKTNVTCAGLNDGTIRAVNVSGGVTPYKFSLDSLNWQTDSVFRNLAAGFYKLFIRDDNSCILVKTNIEILTPSVITLNLQSTESIKCYGDKKGRITVLATGGTGNKQYTRDGGTTWQGSSFNNLVAGTYTIQARDVNGCLSNTLSVTLTQPDTLTFTPAGKNLTCNNAADGSLTIVATGGVTPYNYSKNNGSTYETTNIYQNLTAGTYRTRVRDANGCVTTPSVIVTLTQPTSVNFAQTIVNETCFGDSIGKITIKNASGGNGGAYSFSKNNGGYWQADSVFENLKAGLFNLKVKDAAGCESNARAVTVTQPSAISFTHTKSDKTCSSNGIIGIISVGGGSGSGYRYSKDNGVTWQNSNIFSGLAAGTYAIRVRDNRLCVSDAVSITIVNTCAAPTNNLAILLPSQQIPVVLYKVYPNPTDGLLTLEINTLRRMEANFQFVDVLGKLVAAEKRPLEKGRQNVDFDLTTLPQGVYQVVVEGVNQQKQPVRFVKF